MDPRIERGVWGMTLAVGIGLRIGAAVQRAQTATLLGHIDTRIYRNLTERIAGGTLAPEEGFFMSPAYPYWLSVLSFDGALPPILIFQSLLGIAGVALLALTARRLGGPVAGVATLGLGVLAAPLVLYDGSVLPDGLAFAFLASGLALLVLRSEASMPRLMAFGVCGALAYALRANVLPTLALAAIWLFWRSRPDRRQGSLRALAFLAPTVVVMLTIAILNQQAEGRFVPRSMNAGQNLYIGNNPGTDGTYTSVNDIHPGDTLGRAAAERARGRPLDAAEVEAYWRERALGFMSEDIARTCGLWARKLALVLHPYDVPQMESLRLTRIESSATRLAFVGLGLVLPLAVTGLLGFSRRRDGSLVPLLAAGGVGVLICVLFFVNGRLRHPIWIALLPLAGLGVTDIVAWIRGVRPRREAWRLAVGLGLLALISLYPVHAAYREAKSACRYATLEAQAHHDRQARRWMEVEREIRRDASLQSTFRGHPESRWLLALERAAAWFTLGELRLAFEDLAPAAEALPRNRRAQQGLLEICDRMIQQGLDGAEVRSARQGAMRRLQGP